MEGASATDEGCTSAGSAFGGNGTAFGAFAAGGSALGDRVGGVNRAGTAGSGSVAEACGMGVWGTTAGTSISAGGEVAGPVTGGGAA